MIVVSVGVLFWANKTAKTGFVPNEDRGILFANVELPPGSSLDRTYNVMKALQKGADKIPGVQGISFIAGNSLISGAGNNYGLAFVKLKDFKERDGNKEMSVETITAKLFGMSAMLPDARIIFFSPPSLPGFGNGSGFELQILDKTAGTAASLDANTQKYLYALNQRPEIKYAQSSFSTSYPQYEITVNVPLAKQMGVSVTDIFTTLGGYIGGIYSADFTKFGKQFRVMVQSFPDARNNAESLNNLYIRTSSGQMSPITQFVTLDKVMGPQSMGRFDLYSSAYINGSPKIGFSTGDAIKAVKEVMYMQKA
jgi:HAE1 family hydrophobic/amphiphilic exporter-1